MLSAVYAGIFADDHANQLSVSPDCNTGNCTWPSYATLGVCSECYDITSSIQQECVLSPDGNVDNSIQQESPNCTYRLPHGLTVNSNDTYFGGIVLQVRGMPFLNSPKQTIHFTNLTNPVAIIALLNTTIYGGVLNSSFAAECALQYCVKKYRGSVTLGKFDETLIDTFFNESAGFERSVDLNLDRWTMKASYLSIQPPTSWLGNASLINSSSSFTVGDQAHQNLRYIFDSSDTCNYISPRTSNCPTTIFDGNVSETSSGSIETPYDIPRRLYSMDFDGITTVMANIAHGFTSAMRESKSTYFPNNNKPSSGEAKSDVVIARVRWGWFAVPATLLILTLVFMLLTAWETRRRHAMLWKTSTLPAFYYPLTKDGRSQMTDVASPRQMENTANALKVKWQMTESGMRLVKVD